MRMNPIIILCILLTYAEQCFSGNSSCQREFAYMKEKVHALTMDSIYFSRKLRMEQEERQQNDKAIRISVAGLTTELHGQQMKINLLEKKVKISEDQIINNLTMSVENINKKFTNMEEKMENLVKRQEKLAAEQERDRKETESRFTKLIKELKTANEEMSTLKSSVERLEKQKGSLVSFSAYVSPSIHIPLGHVIKFQKIRNNLGNAYHPHSGIFQAPIDGTYFFHCTLLQKQYGESTLYVNGSKAVMRILAGNGGTDWDLSGNSVIVHLQKGDKVHLQFTFRISKKPLYVHHFWSSFTGFLIKAD